MPLPQQHRTLPHLCLTNKVIIHIVTVKHKPIWIWINKSNSKWESFLSHSIGQWQFSFHLCLLVGNTVERHINNSCDYCFFSKNWFLDPTLMFQMDTSTVTVVWAAFSGYMPIFCWKMTWHFGFSFKLWSCLQVLHLHTVSRMVYINYGIFVSLQKMSILRACFKSAKVPRYRLRWP